MCWALNKCLLFNAKFFLECLSCNLNYFGSLPFLIIVFKNERLPIIRWIRPNNATHGVTILTVDIINGPSPFSVTVFYAQTLSNKRLILF